MSESISTLQTAVRSKYADDADFGELINAFVAAVQEKRRLLADLFHDGSIDELGRMAHQLKGAAGGYGFPDLSAAAAELQHACRAQDAARTEQCLGELLDLLARVQV